MPFKSEAQRRFMYSQKPKLAAEFESKTPNTLALPKYVGDKGKQMRKSSAMKNVLREGM